MTIDADPVHLEMLVDSTGVKDERPLTTNGCKDDQEKEAGRDLAKGEMLDDNSVSKYRSDVARLNYLAADRPDIAFSVKELARRMSEPTTLDVERVRRLVRYLKFRPRAVAWYRYQEHPGCLQAYTDSDLAGCRETRKSTSGGCVMYGSHYLKGWSKTQATRALSSAEAELYNIVKTAAGKEKNKSKELRFDKVLGEANPADMYTKVLASDAIRKHMSTMGFEYADGKDDIALSINELVAEAADKAERLRERARSQPCRSNAKTFRWADCNSEEEQ